MSSLLLLLANHIALLSSLHAHNDPSYSQLLTAFSTHSTPSYSQPSVVTVLSFAHSPQFSQTVLSFTHSPQYSENSQLLTALSTHNAAFLSVISAHNAPSYSQPPMLTILSFPVLSSHNVPTYSQSSALTMFPLTPSSQYSQCSQFLTALRIHNDPNYSQPLSTSSHCSTQLLLPSFPQLPLTAHLLAAQPHTASPPCSAQRLLPSHSQLPLTSQCVLHGSHVLSSLLQIHYEPIISSMLT